MGSYLLRRLGASIITLAGISVIIFALMHAVYPLPGRDVLGLRASSAQVAAWNRDNGYTGPVTVQFWHYLDRWLHGNLGYSVTLNQSVAAVLTVLGNLLADIALTIADPRVRLHPADGRSPHGAPV